jgi:hypothetical protein
LKGGVVDEDLFARAVACLAGAISAAARNDLKKSKPEDEAQFAMAFADQYLDWIDQFKAEREDAPEITFTPEGEQ